MFPLAALVPLVVLVMCVVLSLLVFPSPGGDGDCVREDGARDECVDSAGGGGDWVSPGDLAALGELGDDEDGRLELTVATAEDYEQAA